MAGTINEVYLIGCCQDGPDLQYGNNPGCSVFFRLYTEERFESLSGESKVRRETHSVELYGAAGEAARLWGLAQGDLVGVVGRFFNRGTEVSDGQKHYRSGVAGSRFLPLIKAEATDLTSLNPGHLNRIVLMGRLGSDPEVRYSRQGTAVANVSLATDHPVKDGDDWKEQTTWHRLVIWGRLAEVASAYLSRGRSMGAQGSLRTRVWENDDGERKHSTELVVERLQMLPSGNSGSGAADGPGVSGDEAPF
jgi:single-strand DNA-binding protein